MTLNLEIVKRALRRFPSLYRCIKSARSAYRHVRTHGLPRPPLSMERIKTDLTAHSKHDLAEFLASSRTFSFGLTEKPIVSVVMVLFNRAELTFRCLRSLSLAGVPLEVILVDNASTDETETLCRRIAQPGSGVSYVRNETNRHFLEGTNQGAKLASGKYLLLLNNDTELAASAIQCALENLESTPDAGAVGGKLILPNGRLQEAGSIVWRDGTCLGYGRGDRPDHSPYMFRRDVDYVSGAFLLTPKNLFESLNGFDTAFSPAYYEETDYCLRLRMAGRRVIFDPRIEVAHYEFASSSSSDSALEMQRARRDILLEKHRNELARHELPSPKNVLTARMLPRDQKRILFLDERLPHLHTGAGYPRANAMLRGALELGYFVTMYPVRFVEESETWKSVYSDIPRNVEVMLFEGYGTEGIERFLLDRKGYYDGVIISRPTTMQVIRVLLDRDPNLFGNARVVYDAEALFVLRDKMFALLSGTPFTDEELLKRLHAELDLARGMQYISAVSPPEKKIFEDAGFTNVHIIGHCVESRTPKPAFSERSGLLFVGAIHDDAGPNGDSIWWFLENVLPLLRAKGFTQEVHIVGTNRSQRLSALKVPGVTVVGQVDSLEPYYDNSRVFIAPTRYAAGIPLKVVEAAANGIPAVVTSLLKHQLSWQAEQDLLEGDSAEAFADSVLRLYNDEKLWNTVQTGAGVRARCEYSMDTMKAALQAIFESSAAETEPLRSVG